jgi:outer membrane protein OmpA-like peptidoglycan-associated protein
MHRKTLALALAGCMLPGAPALALDFGDSLRHTMERAAKGEVERKVDQETRKATRCALGDARCEASARAENPPAGDADDTPLADTPDTGGDHPLVSPYRGSIRAERNVQAYTDYERIVGRAGKASRTERLEGKLTRLKYDNPKGRSTFEIAHNYRDALTGRGLRVDYECVKRTACATTGKPSWQAINGINLGIAGDVRYFTGRLQYNDGTAYVAVAVNPQVTYLHVLETARLDQGMVEVDAAALAAGLEKDGRVRLDGIHFDTGKATLKADSNPALDQAALLMRQQATLKLLIAGHTDNVGGDSANRQLSQRRAEAVRNALLARGVSAERLSAQGFGSTVPVADNADEAGRAQNRRVELVKQ